MPRTTGRGRISRGRRDSATWTPSWTRRGAGTSGTRTATGREGMMATVSGLKGALTNPLLSVVMPVYNERSTIEEIIRRVVAVPLRIQLVVVDDGSSDGTRE